MSMSTSTSTIPAVALAKPTNGVAGLQHWRYDIVAGLMVSLTSLPLSLGIAVASGAPPIAGLTSAIIAGLIFPFLGGAYVTISGPAAGLAPALFAAMLTLGHGHLDKGYPLLLAVISVVGVLQIALSFLGAAKLSAAFPVAVVEGMLASIGLMIIAKELPHFIGHSYKSHAFFGILAETPEELRQLDVKALGIGVTCLVLLFVLSIDAVRRRLRVPPPLAVVGVGLVMGRILHIDAHQLIKIPDNILAHGLVLPDYAGLFADRSIVWPIVTAVLTLVMIDGVESLATIKAIDKVDVFKRRSDPDRTLLAMGVSNLCSSLGGGLTIIPGGVKSKLCIVSGGRTLWANFYNAMFLIAYLFLLKGWINLIPYSALAAILIYTGIRMCEPKVWKHVAHVGYEQLFLFTVTVIVTLATDLLIGIIAGMLAKLVLNIVFTSRHVWTRYGRPMNFAQAFAYGVGHVGQLFRNPVVRREENGTGIDLHLDRPLVCFNSIHLNRELDRIPSEAMEVRFHVGEHVAMIDHTSCDLLLHFVEEFERHGTARAEIVGWDQMRSLSNAPNAGRLAPVASMPAMVAAAAEPVDGETLGDVQSID